MYQLLDFRRISVNISASMPTAPLLLAKRLEPALPELSRELIAEVEEVVAAIRTLDGRVAGGLVHVVRPTFRMAHTHHSLYIEDRPSTLTELAKAVAAPPKKRKRARDPEADLRASIAILEWLHEGDGRARALTAPTDVTLLSELHERFYSKLTTEARRLRVEDSGREVDVNPGRWRAENVRVGTHWAPEAEDIDALVDRWSARFDPTHFGSDAERLLASIVSHHRLLFIHPFRDGNGRVARFAFDAALIALGLDAKGSWTSARGFARSRRAYYEALGAADAERRNASDGRGDRSAAGLLHWCRYVLGVIRDQVAFTAALLEPPLLRSRVRSAVTAAIGGRGSTSENAARLVLSVWEHGPLTRGEIVRESAVPDRSARRLLSELAALGWVREVAGEDKRAAPLVGALPITEAPAVFPNLFLPDAYG